MSNLTEVFFPGKRIESVYPGNSGYTVLEVSSKKMTVRQDNNGSIQEISIDELV